MDSLRLAFLNANKIMGLQQASEIEIFFEYSESLHVHISTEEGEGAFQGLGQRPCGQYDPALTLQSKYRQRH